MAYSSKAALFLALLWWFSPSGEAVEVCATCTDALSPSKGPVLLQVSRFKEPLSLAPASEGNKVVSEIASGGSSIKASINSTSKQRDGIGANKLLFVGYLSAPANTARRAQVRKRCIPAIQQAGYDVKFFIGRPNEEGAVSKAQGQRATEVETQLALQLQNESDQYGDIVITPFRDAYRDLSDKVTFLFRHGLHARAENTLKIDDDWCPNMSAVVNACSRTTPTRARYIGKFSFNGDEYEIMKGRDGSVAKFMTGVGFILSSSLARAIFVDDLDHTLLFAPYGTSSDDANIGKWYDYAAQSHKGLEFTREVFPELLFAIDGN